MDLDVTRFAVALVALTLVVVAVLTLARVRRRTDAVVAIGRSVVQLALVSLVIAWAFRHPAAAGVLLAVMVVAAGMTSTRRIGLGRAVLPVTLVAITAGAGVAVGVVLASGALPGGAETVVPFAAQVVGGAMTACSLAGERLRDDVADRWGEVEAGLAIGLTPRQSVAGFAERAVTRALTPALDQTRTAGIVTLPGAFVGLLLGGAEPAEAALVQTLVLAGLLAAESVTAVAATQLLAGRLGATRPTPT